MGRLEARPGGRWLISSREAMSDAYPFPFACIHDHQRSFWYAVLFTDGVVMRDGQRRLRLNIFNYLGVHICVDCMGGNPIFSVFFSRSPGQQAVEPATVDGITRIRLVSKYCLIRTEYIVLRTVQDTHV